MSDVKRNPHCVYQINYHLVWIPRYRKKVLTGASAERLRAICAEIAAELEFEILALEVSQTTSTCLSLALPSGRPLRSCSGSRDAVPDC